MKRLLMILFFILTLFLVACDSKPQETTEVIVMGGYSVDIIEKGKSKTEYYLIVKYLDEVNTSDVYYKVRVELKIKGFPLVSKSNYPKGQVLLVNVNDLTVYIIDEG